MPVTDIKEIRLLPPLAIGRLGSSNEPMHNYDALPPALPAGFRRLAPAPSLVVDPATGAIVNAVTPTAVTFRDGAGKIKPVAPFLELWARFTDGGELEPLTLSALTDLGLTAASVRWEVTVGNLKIFRRTGNASDRIRATAAAAALATHARQELLGTATNFRSGRTMGLGWVQYIRPTAAFPEIRFRFTPARGFVFGHTAGGAISASRAIYNPVAGNWDTYRDRDQPTNPTPRARLTTVPAEIYAQTRPSATGVRANLGFFDDSCDGIVRATIELGGRTLSTFARVSAGPPDFAPDSLPVRSVADDFEQMSNGPDVATVTVDEVIDIVRRATETMRLMNTETQNEDFPFWFAEVRQIFGPAGARYATTRAIHEGILTAVQGLADAPSSAARASAVATLERVVSVLREADNVHDYRTASAPGTRPPAQMMPTLMRGSDFSLLALTHRQKNKLIRAIEQFRPAAGGANPVDAMTRMIESFASFATLHSAIALPTGGTLANLFATPGAMIAYLVNPSSTAHGPVAVSLGIAGRRLVVPRDPAASALIAMITNEDHPMQRKFDTYRDSVTGDNGVVVATNWINSL